MSLECALSIPATALCLNGGNEIGCAAFKNIGNPVQVVSRAR
jgi:hypothetical protein